MRKTSEFFEVQDIRTKIKRQDNPHYWLQQDISQKNQFQYIFFQNIIINEDIVPQIKVYSQFLLKFFRFNYQLLWEEQDQPAFKIFPQTLTRTELLPFIILDEHKHLLYRDPTKVQITYFEVISYDTIFLLNNLKHLIIDHICPPMHLLTILTMFMILLHHKMTNLQHSMTDKNH